MAPKLPDNYFMRYSGMAFQLLATIVLGVWIGTKLDAWQHTQKPIYSIIGALIGVIGGLVAFIRSLPKE
ncbi:MAG: AtpZ/AtpI family protein [Spirosomataceae bacterium]